MGLDMHLRGQKILFGPFGERLEDGFEVHELILELGYWRKHPNLHGYIIQTFADGLDECQRVELNAGQIAQIICAVDKDQLPFTEGFFFGKSTGIEKTNDIKQLVAALNWLKAEEERVFKSVFYQASW